MREKIEVAELVRRFVAYLSGYNAQRELEIVGIPPAATQRIDAFFSYYRPLLSVLWLQAVEYHFPDFVDRVKDSLLEQVPTALTPPMNQQALQIFTKKLAYFSKLTRRDNGMFIVAMDCLDQLAPNASNRGNSVKRLTIHMLERFQALLNTLEGFQLVPDGEAPPPLPPTKAKSRIIDLEPSSPFGDDQDQEDISPEEELAAQGDMFTSPQSPFATGEPGLPPLQGRDAPKVDLDTDDPADLSEDFVVNAKDQSNSAFISSQEENIVDLDDFKLLLNNERRQEARVPSRGMQALVDGNLREFPVSDISVSGIGIEHQGWQFKVDEIIHFDLYYGYKLVLKNVKARVVRRDGKRVGCILSNVSPQKTKLICNKLSERLKDS